MPDARDFGERAATEAQITAWVTLVRAGRQASQGYRVRERAQDDTDSMRPGYGTSVASHDGES